MSDRPLLVTSSSARSGVFSGGVLIGLIVLGVFGTVVLNRGLGVRPLWIAAVLAFALSAGGVSYLTYKSAQGSEVRFFEEGLEAEANTGEGADFSTVNETKRRYEDIDLVLRDDELGDSLFGTGTFELVVSGTGTVRLPHLEQAGEVHQILDQRVPQPADLRRRQERGELDRDSHLWALWDAPEEPRDPVVDADAFEEMARFDLAGADVDPVTAAEEIGDVVDVDSGDVAGIEAVDGVDAGTFDGGDGGGGDGGGGGGGGE